jgi:uncharacterized Zn-binding protein involved in type VI secretion
MPSIQRQGDTNSAGGAAITGVASVRVNGKPVVVDGTPVTAHAPWPQRRNNPHPPHAATVTAGGSGTVRAGGIPVNRTGDVDRCGHPRQGGSPDVRVA